MNNNSKKTNRIICILLMMLFICNLSIYKVSAKDTKIILERRNFEASESGNYFSGSSIDSFSYGRKSLGDLAIFGEVTSEDKYQGYSSYASKGEIHIRYSYDGAYKTDKKEDWNIVSDKTKSVNGIELPKKLALGAIIVQKSTDLEKWKNAQEPITNYFDENIGLRDIYTISEKELKKGTFYRIIVAYKMGRKTGSSGILDVVDEYEYKLCSEVYEFYAYYGGNPIILKDIISGSDISNSNACSSGFIIDKNSSSDTVTLLKGTKKIDVSNYMSVYEPGDYTVSIKSSVGDEYQYNMQVSDGLEMCDVPPTVYENKKKDDYSMSGSISGDTAFGQPSYTTLRIGQRHGNKLTQSMYKGFNAYAISGDKASIFMELTKEEVLKGAGWKIEVDDYGKKEKEKIAGAFVGQVASGALIIQTSPDGVNWNTVDKAKYTNGLYTTDYKKHYSNKGNVCIYTPDGEDLRKGIFIRVLYAYSASNKKAKDSKKYVEKYDMYLFNGELDSVTFHNLSVNDKLSDKFGEMDENKLDMYKHAETIQSGKGTTTGFEIDTYLVPTVKYTVQKDGKDINIPENNKFTDDGKYTINLSSVVGEKKTVTIYVDKSDKDTAIKNYFGEFISGKRIYDENSKCPVFEGGKAKYNINKISESLLPISGVIKNKTTGKSITINLTRNGKSGFINEAGEYEATFTTNPSYEDSSSGDCRKFVFHFKIIPQGSSPGPKINQNELKKYISTSVSDAYPKAYCLIDQSAGSGYIRKLFSTKESALKAAYEREKGMVEETSKGTYKYTGSFVVDEKEEYNDNWDLTDAMNHFAEAAVHEYYLDMSEEESYLTLKQEDIDSTENLRTLELEKTVVIYANEKEKANLTSMRKIPIIAEKPNDYLNIGLNKSVKKDINDFEFIKDKDGYDSNTIKIYDINNKAYTIEYNKGVAKQLKEKNCPSGKITISESTKYGDSIKYEAIYLASEENTAKVKIAYYENGERKELTLTQKDNGKEINAETFSILQINDDIDPYQYISVSLNGENVHKLVADLDTLKNMSEKGKYSVKVVNLIGSEIAFNVNVSESNYSTITFRGDGTENSNDILAKQGDKNISLPELSREGYEFEGYKDSNDNLYSNIMKVVPQLNTIILEPVWKAKECTVTFLDAMSDIYQTQKADYNSRIELPSIDVGAGFKFIGWKMDGEPIESDTILVTSENMVLEPIVEESGIEASETDAAPVIKDNKKGKKIIWIIIAIIGFGVGGFLIFKIKGLKDYKRN